MARKTVIVGFVGRKGGVGKTTLAGNVAAAIALSGRTVAVLDLDAQGSMGHWARAGEGILARIVKPAPTDPSRLRASIEATGAEVVILDSPPSFAPAALAACAVADAVVLPSSPSPLDFSALASTLEVIEEARRSRGGKPTILLAPTLVSGSRRGEELVAAMREVGGNHPILPETRRRAGFASSQLKGKTLVETSPKSVGAEEIRTLAKAILRRGSK